MGGDHSGQMRRSSRTGNDHLQIAPGSFACKLSQQLRGAMGGDNPAFASDAEFAQHFHRMFHRFPIRCAAHDNGDERF